MDVNLYNEIVLKIHNHNGLSIECKSNLQESYPDLHPATLASIISQEYQKRMKQSNYKNSDLSENVYRKYCELKNGNSTQNSILVHLSLEWGIAPAIVARLALKQYLDEQQVTSDENEVENAVKCTKRNISALLKDSTLIEDKDLAYEVFLCTILDDQYSPTSEAIKHTVGQQYEIRLQRHLAKLGIAFRDENSLRKYGYDKTPDVKLEVPIAIDGFVINWIESKALFGDEDVHRSYMRDQYLSYWNRFGPGLVIYWFGYLETIKDPSDKRILILDNVPDSFTHFNSTTTNDVLINKCSGN